VYQSQTQIFCRTGTKRRPCSSSSACCISPEQNQLGRHRRRNGRGGDCCDDDGTSSTKTTVAATACTGIISPNTSTVRNAVNNLDKVMNRNTMKDICAMTLSISQVMKSTFPEDQLLVSQFKAIIQQCVSQFVTYLKSEASDTHPRGENRTHVIVNDLLYATSTLGFCKNSELMKEIYDETKKLRDTQLDVSKSRFGVDHIPQQAAARSKRSYTEQSVVTTVIPTTKNDVAPLLSCAGDTNANQNSMQKDIQMLQSENVSLKATLHSTILQLQDLVTKLSKDSTITQDQYVDLKATSGRVGYAECEWYFQQ
jgi:hypothetical protein